MSGECKSYRLNEPMAWKEFKAMPDDIKVTYIKLLQQKFGVPFIYIGKMMGCAQRTISCEIIRLGLSEGKAPKGRSRKWDKEGFWAWANGVDLIPAPVPEEVPVEDTAQEEPESIITEEPEVFMEEDIPIEETNHSPIDDFAPVWVPVTAIPTKGSMNFNCPANQALNTLAQVLGDSNVSISVMWRVIKEEGVTEDGKID